MKRRTWIWFIISAVLAVLAGVLALLVLDRAAEQEMIVAPEPKQSVVVARQPLAANSILRADNVTIEERQEIPSGAAVQVQDVLGTMILRDIAEGEVILMQDITSLGETRNLPRLLGDNKLAVAMPADDILSEWGAVLPGDHVDVLFTHDVILETPMYPADWVEDGNELETIIERDQSMDGVTMLALQNLEVLQILEEPQPAVQGGQQDAPLEIPERALLLKIDPQDALVLKYLINSASAIDLALRSPTNTSFYEVQPVNINYLTLRYGILIPQPLEE